MAVNLLTDIIEALPPLQGDRDVIVPGEQSVRDIMKEVLESHKVFEPDYDCIPQFFMDADPLRSLFQFCKDLPYKAEDETDQTSRSPIAILMLADSWGNDCKHYSGWIGGVIDACNRAGYTNYDWCYRFASYDLFDSTKEHVYVVINPGGGDEIWLDPAPIDNQDGSFIDRAFNDRKVIPFYITDKKPKAMSLNRISGCSINPNYQAQSMGYISLWRPSGDDDFAPIDTYDTFYLEPIDVPWESPFDQIQPSQPETPVYYTPETPTVYYDPGIIYEPPLTADPAVPTFDPTLLNRLEPINEPFISDYPTITGEPPISLPTTTATTTTTTTTNNNTGLTTGFDFMTFIKTNPVETILIGSAVVIGGLYLLKKNKKKKRQRA